MMKSKEGAIAFITGWIAGDWSKPDGSIPDQMVIDALETLGAKQNHLDILRHQLKKRGVVREGDGT